MAVQDDKRETEMRELVGLRAGEARSGIDAYLDFVASGRRYAAPIELKSTTVGSVSTARDVGPEHMEKWRSRVWLIGFYDSGGTTLERLLALGPDEMEPWISRIESYIAPDFRLGERAAKKLGIDDLHVICGEKSIYMLEDAKALYKRQWSESDYVSEMDLPNGYSPRRMLRVLRLRARYLSDRGSTLNNPHIPMRFLSAFADKMAEVSMVGSNELKRRVGRRVREITMESAKLRTVAATTSGGG